MRIAIKILTLANFIIVSAAFSDSSVCSVNEVYNSKKDLNVAIISKECSLISPYSWTYINSAIWTINYINSLNTTSPLSFGLTVFQTCGEADDYNAIYKIFKENNDDSVISVFTDHPMSNRLKRFSELLEVNLRVTNSYQIWVIEATVKLLLTFNVTSDVTIFAENENQLKIFYSLTKRANICVNNGINFEEMPDTIDKVYNGILVLFGKPETINVALSNFTRSNDSQIIFVPLDLPTNIDFPEGSYVILPLFSNSLISSQFSSSPILFNIAGPLVEIITQISDILFERCNLTTKKMSCLRNNHHHYIGNRNNFDAYQILNILNIEQLADNFVYNVFRVENLTLISNLSLFIPAEDKSVLQSFVHIFTYSAFNKTLMSSDYENGSSTDAREPICPTCRVHCVNFVTKVPSKTVLISYAFSKFGLRAESWVFAFLAISLLGVIFCIAVFIFLVVRFFKNDIFEGNPSLTIILLFTVILMYCAVTPYVIDSDKEARNYICIAKALSTTLTYAFAFSLLLSRSVLLATISKEVGFMAHVAGPVQSFLTLFMFGVQGALSIQFVNHCEEVFRGIAFVYLMSYNILLVILLLFICPLNTRSQRNYKEGRHFTAAVAIIACVWSCWIPGYAVFDEKWKEPMLCLGLVSTASILLGAIFIPRTYMMTVAATRDRLTSALPSLQANSSIVDVYRASTQPIYDCINITAINARCGPPPAPPLPQTEVYSSLAVPYEEEFQFERPASPNPDKVTRF